MSPAIESRHGQVTPIADADADADAVADADCRCRCRLPLPLPLLVGLDFSWTTRKSGRNIRRLIRKIRLGR